MIMRYHYYKVESALSDLENEDQIPQSTNPIMAS